MKKDSITLNNEKCIDNIIKTNKGSITGIIDIVTPNYILLKDGRWFTNPSTVTDTTRKHYKNNK